MVEKSQTLLAELGFRFGINGPHAARTMMLEDVRVLFAEVPPEATKAEYASAVVELNVLGKPTRKARELALRHITSLYGLDTANPIFRALRRFWTSEVKAQPLLALAVSLARDPLLRATQSFVLKLAIGTPLPRQETEAFLNEMNPNRFSPASLKSFAQNVAGTWTSAGFLDGRSRKTRAVVELYPEVIAFLLFLGFLEGRSGQRLFTSNWMQLADRAPQELDSLVTSASNRGFLVFMNAGGVKEVRFPGFLTADEEMVRQEISFGN